MGGDLSLPKWFRAITRSRPSRFAAQTVERYLLHGVGQEAAALAYFLLFTIFPLAIFLSSLLGLLELDISHIVLGLRSLLPNSVVDLVESYLGYVSGTSSKAMLWFGLVFTIYFPMRAADSLMSAVRKAYQLPRPKNRFFYMAKVLMYTVFLLVTIALTLALATIGRAALEFAGRFIVVPAAFIELWEDLRFLILGGVMFAAIGLLYAAAQDGVQPAGNIVPGALAALVGWMIVSAAFSFYVEHFANYSVIYGTLGAVIVLMMWLNLTAVMLVMGAEINGVLISIREKPVPKFKKGRSVPAGNAEFPASAAGPAD